MILMVCVDDNGGMMFHRRRQSRDRRLVERILTLTQGSLLRMNAYSAALFSGHERKQICISEDFLQKAEPGTFCFVENVSILPYLDKIERIIRFRWNRVYPADQYFEISLETDGWRLMDSESFAGSSHPDIKMEVYEQ